MEKAIVTVGELSKIIQIVGTFIPDRDMIISIKEYEKLKERYESTQELRTKICGLEMEIEKYKRVIKDNTHKVFLEHSEKNSLKSEISSLKETIDILSKQNTALKEINSNLSKKVEKLEKQKVNLKIDKELLHYLKTNYKQYEM